MSKQSDIKPVSFPSADLEEARPLYFLPQDDLKGEVLIPGFQAAETAECMVGFFSSAVLAELAPGLASYIQNASSGFRMIISPFLTEADRQALQDGVKDPEDIAFESLSKDLITTDDLQRHTLRCLSYLIAREKIEIRIALMRNALFHPKVWIFSIPGGRVAVHGSSNMTQAGLVKNKEQITVSKSWADPTQKYIVEKLSDEFERLWKGEDQDCLIVPLPEAIKQDILKNYSSSEIPTEDELNDLWAKAQRGATSQKTEEAERTIPPRPAFSIPTWLKYDEGPYAHQGRAIAAWVEAGFRGTLEMATGSGKTLTAMIGAFRLYELQNPLLIVVSAPYVPLIQQWCSEITLFGLQPVNLTTLGNATERSRVLQQLRRRLRLGLSNVEIVVVSHDTLCTSSFIESLRSFECSRLLIADEAHNLGRDGFIKNSPDFIEYRLALSATPIRQYDPEGTLELLDYFGSIVFRFTLADAIGKCLVEYDYYVHPVELSEAEMDSWVDLTARIRQISWRQIDGAPDDFLAKLLRDRRAILETAKGKIPALASLLDREDIHSLKHTLIYASDKAPEQLRSVNALLNRKGILFHQLTSEETADRAKTASIIRAFQNGELQVLTAKRVLDEGVNIPQITKAYILASTTVGRQWIQRRGRLLRICPEIGKTHSVIHDFVVLPPMLEQALDDDARSLVKSELIRLQDFASLARNAGKPDGPLPVIHKLVEAAML